MRKTWLMAGIALVILIVLAVCWQYLGPFYSSTIATVAKPLLAPQVTIKLEGIELFLTYDIAREGKSPLVGIRSLTLHYGALLVTSLILATIFISWRKRMIAVAVAWLAFFLVALVTVTIMSWGLKWTLEGGPTNLNALGPVMTITYIGFPALASAIWCARYWSPTVPPKDKRLPKDRGQDMRS